MSITERSVYVACWFKRYEQESKKCDSVSIETVYPYIFFKLAYDFAFSKENSIDIHDPVAINYFMGNFCYNQAERDFKRSAIVMATQKERVYFGSPIVSQQRMRNASLQKGKSVDGLVSFITYLEEKVFNVRLSNFDEMQKETLGMILRIINQGVSAAAIKMFNAYLQVRSGEIGQVSSDSLSAIRYLIRPNYGLKKGSTQIDIVCDGDGKIQLHRREYVKVQKLDMDSQVNPDSAKDELWCLMMLLSKDGTGKSSDWRLHFSVSNIPDDCESTSVYSSANSLNKASQLGRVSSDLPLHHSDLSTLSGGSLISIDSHNSARKPANEKSDGRRTRSRSRRPLRDLIYKRKAEQSSKFVCNSLDWLKQFKEYSDVKRTRNSKALYPYIDFKRWHNLPICQGRCLWTQDWVAINYFLGSFCYRLARERFHQNTLVLTTETKKLYFGSSASPNDDRSVHEDDGYNGDFVAFINCLEKEVFKRSFREINTCQKRTLGVILRFLSQNSSAVVSKLFKLCVRTGPVRGNWEHNKDNIQVEGLAQIGIESKGDNIYLSKEQNFTVQKYEEESMSGSVEDITESWKMVTNIMQINSMSHSNWNLHFSVMQHSLQDRLTLTPSESSQNSVSFCYSGNTLHNLSISCSSSKTGMDGTSPGRSSPDCVLMNGDEVKKREDTILPLRKRKTLSDEHRNRIDYKAQKAPSSVLTDVDDLHRFRWIESKENDLPPASGNWIAKDHLGI